MAMMLETRKVAGCELEQMFHRLLEMDRSSDEFEAAYAEFDRALEAAMAQESSAFERQRATA